MRVSKRGSALRAAALNMALLGACVPTPAQLLQQMTGLEKLTVAATVQHAKVCASHPPTDPEPEVCGILVSCFAELQGASGTCRDAIAQGRTSSDQAYAQRARACVEQSRVAAIVCPSPPKATVGRSHVP